MKLLALIIIVLLIFAIWALIAFLIDNGTDGFKEIFNKHKEDSAKWIITPRTGEHGEPEIFLTRGESEEFFFWPTPLNSEWEFDRAMLEAEVQAGEFNRTRKQLSA